MNRITFSFSSYFRFCLSFLLFLFSWGAGPLLAADIRPKADIALKLAGDRRDVVVGEPLSLQVSVPAGQQGVVLIQEGTRELVQVIPNPYEKEIFWPDTGERTVPDPRQPYRLSLDEPGELHVYVVTTTRDLPRIAPMDRANPFPPIGARSQAELVALLDRKWGRGQARAVAHFTIPVSPRRPEDEQRALTFVAGELQTEDLPLFSDGGTQLSSSRNLQILRNWGRAMNSPAHAGECYLIEGHTDSRGKDLANLELGQRRAEAVVAFLVEQCGVPARRLTAISKGAFEPRADNANRQGRAENRRVVVVLDRIEGSREAVRLFTD